MREELPEIKKRRPVALPPAPVERLLSDPDVPPWFVVLVALAALAGLEAGTALGLEVRDVELRDSIPWALHIRQAVALVGPEGHASVQGTKNKHRGSEETPRILPVHPALAAILAWWLDCERERWTCAHARPTDLLVPNAEGKAWRPKVAERLRSELTRIGEEVPKRLDYQGLRRAFATWLAAAGVPKDVRQRLMRHAGDVEAEHYEANEQLLELDRAAISKIPVAVPFAVLAAHVAAQQGSQVLETVGTPGRNRTCDLRFRNSRDAVPADRRRLVIVGDSAAESGAGIGKSGGIGSPSAAAVLDAVRRAADELRATVLPFEAAEAMLAGLEEAGA